MSNYQQMQNDLQLMVQANLLQTDLGNLLNIAAQQEVESYEWSFLYTNVVIGTIVPESLGTVDVTLGSTQIVGHGTAFTGVEVGWLLRAGATLTTPFYVQSVNVPTQTLTINSPFAAPSQTGITYLLWPQFYDVFPLIEVYSVRQINPLHEVSREKLNRVDPSRISGGGNPCDLWALGIWDPTNVNNANPSLSNQAHFSIELWPVPGANLPYIVEGKSGFIPMVNPTDQPQLPSAVIEYKAAYLAAMSIYASSGNARWAQMAESYDKKYQDERNKAIQADNKRSVIRRLGENYHTSFGVDLLMNHDFIGTTW